MTVALVVSIASVVIALASLAVAGIGTVLSNRRSKESLRISQAALEDSRKVQSEALWWRAVEAVLNLIGLDPSRQSVSEPMLELRVAWTALADGLPEWAGLEKWLAIEHMRGAWLAREALELKQSAKSGGDVDQHFARLKPFIDWGTELSMQLRRFRDSGYDRRRVEDLLTSARVDLLAINKRNGWELPGKL